MAAIDGKWKASAPSPLGVQYFDLDLQSDGDVVTGTVIYKGTSGPINNGKLDGDSFYFEMTIETPIGPGVFKCTTKLDGDTLSGPMRVPGGRTKLTANRVV